MSESVAVQLNVQQRDLLLTGLRYMGSSVMLEIHEPTVEFVDERSARLTEIDTLVEQLSGSRPAGAAV